MTSGPAAEGSISDELLKNLGSLAPHCLELRWNLELELDGDPKKKLSK